MSHMDSVLIFQNSWTNYLRLVKPFRLKVLVGYDLLCAVFMKSVWNAMWSNFFILGWLEKLWEAPISLVMSVYLSAWSNSFSTVNFCDSLYWGVALESVNIIQFLLKLDKNNGHVTQRPKCVSWEYHHQDEISKHASNIMLYIHFLFCFIIDLA
jgi:hypothetical protein